MQRRSTVMQLLSDLTDAGNIKNIVFFLRALK